MSTEIERRAWLGMGLVATGAFVWLTVSAALLMRQVSESLPGSKLANSVLSFESPTTLMTAVVVPGGGLNVRTEPGGEGEVAFVAPSGSRLRMTGEERIVGGETWWELRGGGWVQGQYVDFELGQSPLACG
ncbi:MAG: SH3 domain-containing protein [Chloroflexi bacterium]|nr:SH3 domain-containing protein [Chloroflexota bacterium]